MFQPSHFTAVLLFALFASTVFGWKQNTTWRFFYQQRAVVFYMYRVTDRQGAVHTVPVPRQCAFNLDEFWPNGSGVAVGKALVP